MAKAKINIPSIEDMLEAGVHFGHQIRRRSPFMDKFVYGIDNKSHIIDVYKTQESLKNAAEFLHDIAERGGQIVLVGTKRQASPLVKELAEKANILYINQRWLGGTFTNFDSIKRRIEHMKKLIERRDNKELAKYTKKEQLLFEREIEKLSTYFGGITDLKKYPEAIVVVDIKKERVAVHEANAVKVPVVALVDTNSDPRNIQKVIPGNDDAIKSIEIVMKTLVDAIIEGAKGYSPEKAAVGKSVPTSEKIDSATKANTKPAVKPKTETADVKAESAKKDKPAAKAKTTKKAAGALKSKNAPAKKSK